MLLSLFLLLVSFTAQGAEGFMPIFNGKDLAGW
ncbi:MAG TPA: DUF1080 domain-containing protein, partial [Verrucomicrobiales bacterium]|nr:DUF1080 domain-containing protein [Verrucomicrobiales bacterium]